MKPQTAKKQMLAFELYMKDNDSLDYPKNLLTIMHQSNSKRQIERANILLHQWARQYQKMSQLSRERFKKIMETIQKKLIVVQKNNPCVETVIAIIYSFHYQKWHQLTNMLANQLLNKDFRNLSLLWFILLYAIEKIDCIKNIKFTQFLASKFQEPLRKFQPAVFQQADKLLDCLRLVNLLKAQQPFLKNSKQWISIIENLLGKEQQYSMKYWILKITVLGSRPFLKIANSFFYQSLIIKKIEYIEDNINNFTIKKPFQLKILDNFLAILEYKQTRQLLFNNSARYIKTILLQINRQKQNPNSPFHSEKYLKIKYEMFKIFLQENFELGRQKLIKKANELIKKANNTIYDQQLTEEFQVISQIAIEYPENTFNQIIKFCVAPHLRSKMPIVYYTTAASILRNCKNKFKQQQLSQVMKGFMASANQKASDTSAERKALLSQFRKKASQLFLHLLHGYIYQAELERLCLILLQWIETYEREELSTCLVNLKIIMALIEAQNLFKEQKKLSNIISHVSIKLAHQNTRQNVFCFLSLVLSLHTKSRSFDPRQYALKHCRDFQTEPHFFDIKIQALIKALCIKESPNRKQIYAFFEQIISKQQFWIDYQRCNLWLMSTWLLPRICPVNQVRELLQANDNRIKILFEFFIAKQKYVLLFLLASKIFPVFDDYQDIIVLQSYKLIKQKCFDILSQSFNKGPILSANALFSSILCSARCPEETFDYLNKQQFIIYLFKGCDDFISKQKQYSCMASVILMAFIRYKKSRKELAEFTRVQKNVGWWKQSGFVISLQAPFENQLKTNLMEPFEKFYYENLNANLFNCLQRIQKQIEEKILPQKANEGQQDQN